MLDGPRGHEWAVDFLPVCKPVKKARFNSLLIRQLTMVKFLFRDTRLSFEERSNSVYCLFRHYNWGKITK